MPHKKPEDARAYDRERYRRRTADRLARGLCPRCGKHPPAPERKVCEPCGERARDSERLRYAGARARGARYGGRNPENRRRMARERNRKRKRERREAGLCTGCGKVPPLEGGAVCETCREARREAEGKLYAERRTGGLCGRCGAEVIGNASTCASCVARDIKRRPRKNAASRARYHDRRARGLCVDCSVHADAGVRCGSCALRSYLSSGEHKGLALYPPRYTVVELVTGAEHGPLDSWEEVAMCLAFAKLSREEVEIVSDEPLMSTIAAWE